MMLGREGGGYGFGGMGIGSTSTVSMNSSKAQAPMSMGPERTGSAGGALSSMQFTPHISKPSMSFSTSRPSSGMGPMQHGSAMPPGLSNFGL